MKFSTVTGRETVGVTFRSSVGTKVRTRVWEVRTTGGEGVR